MNRSDGAFDFAGALRKALGDLCLLTDQQCAALQVHFEMLQEWNRRMNLTSIREPNAVVERHYCESIFLGCYLPMGAISVADVGSGAGFPGVGVAEARPLARVTLIESNSKKAVFLRESTRHLSNVRVLNCRAEDVKERFDWLVSRAVAWDDLAMLGDRVALLAAEPGPDFAWRERIRLPWGNRRVLLIG